MAIGGGFTDIAMIRESDVGIQLSSKDVPLVFGDITVSSIGFIGPMLFQKGKEFYINVVHSLLTICYHHFQISWMMALVDFDYQYPTP